MSLSRCGRFCVGRCVVLAGLFTVALFAGLLLGVVASGVECQWWPVGLWGVWEEVGVGDFGVGAVVVGEDVA